MNRLTAKALAIAIAIVATLSACAKNHDAIAPEPVPPWAYAPATCQQLREMRAKTTRTLIFAEIIQDARYSEDRTRTFGVPTPMATIFETNRESDIARLKGESLALAAQIERKRCIVPAR